MDELAKHYRAAAQGKRNKVAGEFFENIISATCTYYSDKGIAEIEKTPEPMRPIKNMKNGKFVAIFTKMAQPDYKGTLSGGKAIVFEAKHTDIARMKRDVISSEQEEKLNCHQKLGATCFILCSFGFESFFKVPWTVFRDMKENFGRKYITPNDLERYRVRYIGGVLHFLE